VQASGTAVNFGRSFAHSEDMSALSAREATSSYDCKNPRLR
jgi:hypothetical protein